MLAPTPTIKHKGLTTNPAHYIYPPRSQDAMPYAETGFLASMGWVAQLKYNDSRCLIKYLPGEAPQLWNRHASTFRDYTPTPELLGQLAEVHTRLGLDKTKWSLLDGGILDKKHSAIKQTVVIWDILVRDNVHLLGSQYTDRYDFLAGNLTTSTSYNFQDFDIGLRVTDNVLLPRNHAPAQWDELWTGLIPAINAPYTVGKPGDRNYDCKPVIEGLVFKDLNGKLERGMKEKNNSGWMCRCRVQTGRHLF